MPQADGFPSQPASAIDSSGPNAAFARIDSASPKCQNFFLFLFAVFSL